MLLLCWSLLSARWAVDGIRKHFRDRKVSQATLDRNFHSPEFFIRLSWHFIRRLLDFFRQRERETHELLRLNTLFTAVLAH